MAVIPQSASNPPRRSGARGRPRGACDGGGDAYDATVEAEDDQTDVDVEEVLVEQGFQLWWQQLTASPVTWMAQVFDAIGEKPASGVGDDPVDWASLAVSRS